jgi:hypothetical protein
MGGRETMVIGLMVTFCAWAQWWFSEALAPRLNHGKIKFKKATLEN